MSLKIKGPAKRKYVVVHQKKIHVGDYIEVFKGIWQGVFKVDQIQHNRYLPCRFANSQGNKCWPSRLSFRKFDQHEIE